MDDAEIFGYFLSLLAQIKMYHWSTLSYAKHKALDDLHGALSEKSDTFIEAWMGRMKKQPVTKLSVALGIVEGDAAAKPEKYVAAEHARIAAMSAKTFAKAPELQNILEEMLAEMAKTLYLLNLA